MEQFLLRVLPHVGSYNVVLLASLLVFAFGLKVRSKAGLLIFLVGVVSYLSIPGIYYFFTGRQIWICPVFYVTYWYNASYLVYWAFAMLIFYAGFVMSLKEMLYYGIAAYTAQNLSHNIRAVLRVTFWENQTEVHRYLLTIFTAVVILILYYYIFVRNLKKVGKSPVKNGYMTMFLLAVLLIVNVYSSYWMVKIQNGNFDKVDTYGSVYAIMVASLLLIIQFGIFEQSKLSRDKIVLNEIISNNEKQHEFSKENIELINMKCHDLKHQINEFRKVKDKEESSRYLDEIEQAVMIYDNIAKTGDEALDTILTSKSLYCEKNEIQFTYMVDGKLLGFMEKMDIYALFGNAIENAIECVIKIPEKEKRIITLYSRQQGNATLIEVENYCEEQLKFKDGLPVTTKNDQENHGFGVKSMKYIVEKYGGTLTAMQKNERFTLRILFVNNMQNGMER